MRLKVILVGLTTSAVLNCHYNLSAQKSSPPTGTGQSVRFERISLEQELSQSTVYCMLQDSKGFMWFGTEDGLNKYDGYTFTVYKHDPENPNSLSNNEVRSIYEDQSGALWVGTVGGLNKLVPNENEEAHPKFLHYKNNPDNPNSLSHNAILSIYEDRSGGLWIGTEDGLNKLVPGESQEAPPKFIHYNNDPENPSTLSHSVIRSIYQGRSGALWIGTEGGLNKLVPNENKESPPTFVHYKNDPDNPNSLSHNVIRAIYEDGSGALWIGTEGGLNRFDREQQTFTHYKHHPDHPHSLSHDAIRSVYEDQSGVLWIGTWGGGLNALDPRLNQGKKQPFTHYKNDPDTPNSLSHNRVRSIYQDRSGVLWIGTEDGLNKFDRKKAKFIHYKHDPDNPNSLNNDVVWSIFEDRSGILWIGTWGGGLNRFDREQNTFTHYEHNPNNRHSLSDNVVWSIYEDRSGGLWIGTKGGLNKVIQNETKGSHPEFIHYTNNPHNPNSLSSNNVRSIREDQSGTLWVGTHGDGLNKLVPSKNAGSPPTFIHYKANPDNPNSLSNNNVWSIHEDQSGSLWIGTWGGGLNKLIPNENAGDSPVFRHYTSDPDNRKSLSNNRVLSIYEDHTGVLWIGTAFGLNKLVPSENAGSPPTFIHYTEQNGLPNDVIYGILEDNQGNLWLSTNKGLSKFNPQSGTFKNYDTRDGLQSDEFNVGAYHKSRNGEMFFGGVNGFNAFYPDQVEDNPHVPPIVITAVKRFDEIVKRDISATDEINLSYKDKYLTLEFVALHYTIPEKNQYAYRMEGFDEDWIYAGTRRVASYTNLDPGNYVFKVRGSNNDGVWNEDGVSMRITITPPPWQTWWAYMLYAIFVVGALYGIRRYELNRIRLKNQLKLEHMEAEKLKELDHLKSRFFANISHEFRTPLTLILGPIEHAISKISNKATKSQLRTAFHNAHRLLRLINQLLDLSKLEAGGSELKARCRNLIPFLKGVVFTFESLANKKQITLDFTTDYPHLNVYFDAEKLEEVFYNLLSNAIKFTPDGGTVSVTVDNAPIPPRGGTWGGVSGFIQITVSDTGIGIPADRLPHIFDRFYQATEMEKATGTLQDRAYQTGTGIGLALARELVELHYGDIAVNSEEGKGTQFIVTLPLGKDHLKEGEIADEFEKSHLEGEKSVLPPTVEAHPASEARIPITSTDSIEDREILLIVEDNPDVRAYIRQHLETNYTIIEAADGADGFEKAADAIPDVMISDIMMPEMDGYELCHALKNDQRTSHIPVILLTAKAGEQNKLHGLKTGADDYLTKPFSSRELSLRVKNLIEQRRKLRERYSREVILKPAEIAITSMDEQFLNRVKEVVEEYLGDEDFTVEELGHEVGMSRVQLHRKLRALTNQSASQFILSMRLQRAVDLMKRDAGTLAEIAYSVGFNTPNYFAKCFRKQFGCAPSEYREKLSR